MPTATTPEPATKPKPRPLNEIRKVEIEAALQTCGDRLRKDMGDIAGLAADLEANGQHTPILVTRDGALVDGERRCRAAQKLGWTHVDARALPITSTDGLRAIEISATNMRKGFNLEEKMAVASFLEGRAKEEARERMRRAPLRARNGETYPGSALDDAPALFPDAKANAPAQPASDAPAEDAGPEEEPEATAGQVRDYLAAQIGMGGRTFDKAKALRERGGDLWAEALRQAAGGSPKIDSLYKRLREKERLAEIREKLAAEKKADEANEPPDKQPFTILHGDSLEVLAQFAGQADLIATDIPYNLGAYGGYSKTGTEGMGSFDAGEWDKMDPAAYLEWMERAFVAMRDALAPTGSLYCFIDRFQISAVWEILKKIGMKAKNVLVLAKPNPPPNARRNWDSAWEACVFAARGKEYIWERAAEGPLSNVISMPNVGSKIRQAYPHPTAKPPDFWLRVIETSTLRGQLVIDPFAGSGSTLEAALRLRRRVVGIDSDPNCVAMCEARCKETLAEAAARLVE